MHCAVAMVMLAGSARSGTRLRYPSRHGFHRCRWDL